MSEVFLRILNMSIAASWMILAVIVIRFLLKKVPKTFHCILWAMVGVRLIFPFSIESALSLIPSNETIVLDTSYSEMPVIRSGISIINEALNPILSETFGAEKDVLGADASGAYVADTFSSGTMPQSKGNVSSLQHFIEIASIVWAVGAAAMLCYALFSYLRLHRKVKISMKMKENIWLCDYIDSPFILGVIKPRIYIPTNLKECWMDSVIAHENAHIHRHDHLWKPLGFLILSIYWFHPLVWIAYLLLCKDIELACDERVIREMDVQEKKDYSKALLSCSVPHHMVAACPLAFGEVGVKTRIKSVLNYRKPGFWMMAVSVVLCIVVAVCFLTNPSKDNVPAAEELSAEITESCGADARVFAVDDSVSGYIFAGYTTEKRVGIAYFKYDSNQEEYVLSGYEENFPEYPFGVTVGEELGLDHCVTIAVSSRKEVAFIEMEYKEEKYEVGVPVYPVMVLREWDKLLPEEQDSSVSVTFYDENHEKLAEGTSLVPYYQNEDGTWSADGYTYKYLVELRGTMPNAASESAFIVLTNDKGITFEDAWWSLFGSHSDNWLDPNESKIVDIK